MARSVKMSYLRTEEKPREKLVSIGSENLTDVELLALVIGTGTKKRSCLEIARDLLNTFSDLNGIAEAKIEQLKSVGNLGSAKISAICAITEISKRIATQKPANPKAPCTKPDEAYKLVQRDLYRKEKEVVIVLHLNSRNQLISKEVISVGTRNTSLIDPREIVKSALLKNSTGLILAHNHPSGNTAPSPEDIRISQNLYKVCEQASIPLIDHLIVGTGGYTSLKSLGLLERG